MDEKQQRIEVGKRLRTLRTEHLNLNQTDMAEKIGYSQGSYARLERGDFAPNIESLNVLYTHYFVNVKWIMSGEGAVMLSEAERAALQAKLASTSDSVTDLLDTQHYLKPPPSVTKTALLATLAALKAQVAVLEAQLESL